MASFMRRVHYMKPVLLLSYPKAMGTSLALVSLCAGATALVAADFGTPAWLFSPLLVWLLSIGLPTTIAVLLTASFWGLTPPFHGFVSFATVTTLLALIAQI